MADLDYTMEVDPIKANITSVSDVGEFADLFVFDEFDLKAPNHSVARYRAGVQYLIRHPKIGKSVRGIKPATLLAVPGLIKVKVKQDLRKKYDWKEEE